MDTVRGGSNFCYENEIFCFKWRSAWSVISKNVQGWLVCLFPSDDFKSFIDTLFEFTLVCININLLRGIVYFSSICMELKLDIELKVVCLGFLFRYENFFTYLLYFIYHHIAFFWTDFFFKLRCRLNKSLWNVIILKEVHRDKK